MSERFSTRIRIADRYVGPEDPVYVIAEIGANHNQDIGLAKALIDAAKDAGADAAKFQSLKFEPLYLSGKTSPQFREFFRQIELSEEWYGELASHCRERKIHFISSVAYLEAVNLLRQAGVPAYKIASAQFGIFPEVVAEAAMTGLPLLMSTGFAGYGDIQGMLDLCRQKGNLDVVLLHCVSQYPADMKRANLRLIETYRRTFGSLVGYSDHTLGIHAASAAVALGAVIVEKHITADRNMDGPDHHFAIEPEEFGQMVRNIRDIEVALGDGVRPPLSDEERAFREKISMKWVSEKDLKKGDRVDRARLTLRRAEGGIPRAMIDQLLCHRVKRDIPAGSLITWEDLEYAG